MAIQWNDLVERFRDRLKVAERGTASEVGLWQRCCLEQALDVLEEDPDAASARLDDFDRAATSTEVGDLVGKVGKVPTVDDIRRRFDNLGGGIV
jgi:hypothetical protein